MRTRIVSLFSLIAALMTVMAAPSYAAEVPKNKQTALGKYVTAKEAYDLVQAERDKVLFLDVRTSAEMMFVGMTEEVDAAVPFVEMSTAWDDKSGRFQLNPNGAFIAQVEALLAKKGLTKADRIVLMCRSGERSARGVDVLAGAGFTNVYSQIEGFEGDSGKDGRRSVNGWKNAGLPWGYKLDKAKPIAVNQ